MDESIPAQLERLRGMPADQMRALYREVLGVETRKTSRQYLRRRIAWQVQARAEGDISEKARRYALETAQDVELNGRVLFENSTRKKARKQTDKRMPSAGTELIRVFRGRTIVAKILPNGVECEGHLYTSLSAAAAAVTGTRWNGLVFFGLAKRGETLKRKRRGSGKKRKTECVNTEASRAA